jgi:glycosyltransferase involved in cell wall biosynthesis
LTYRESVTTTLVITTYNWPAALELTLRSAARQSVMPDEIIVADDGSGPETAHVVERFSATSGVPLLHVWQPDQGFRLARSRNRAIAVARSNYIIIVDGDMVLHEHFIADHKRAARRGSFIQGVRLLTEPDAAESILREGRLEVGFFAHGIRRRRHAIRNLFLSRLLFAERTGQRAIRGCNQAYWRSDLVRVNGFNEACVGWGREDNEIAARLYNAGMRRRNLKFQALAIHLHHPSRNSAGENPNDAILREAIGQRVAWCPLGVDQHLQTLVPGKSQYEIEAGEQSRGPLLESA